MDVTFDASLLTAEQADGTACGLCGFDYSKEILAPGQLGRDHSPVGFTTDGIQIFACSETCLPRMEAFHKLFAETSQDDLTLVFGYIEANHMDVLMDAFEHIITMKAKGETPSIQQLKGYSSPA